MNNNKEEFYTLNSADSSCVIDCRGNAPAILYWGARLKAATTPDMLALLATRQQVPAGVEQEVPVSLSPEIGAGFAGNAGIQAHRSGKKWGVYAQIEAIEEEDGEAISIRSVSEAAEIVIVHRLELDVSSNLLVATTEIENTGADRLSLSYCAAPTIPLPAAYTKILSFEGRWCGEFQLRSVNRFLGSFVRENRSGRTSHDSFPGLMVHTHGSDESRGGVYALHLGWSGNHSVRVEELSDGRAYAQLGELFFPGELTLAPGERYCSPSLYGVHSEHGFGDASRCFHRFTRDRMTDVRMQGKTKPVHFNTWEAVYFDLSLDKLLQLADAAAALGAERFVLDDGWFKGRRSDQAGLGDWTVDEGVFPDGLKPLIDHVNAAGMEFGLWVEPEMVNIDSDLYRAHPDWVLNAAPAPQLVARHQLTLDLTRAEVAAYLFECIDSLLGEYPIRYLKWDMNRDLSQPGGRDGIAVTHAQTLACYELLRRIRAAHPEVEIESCASGGGRIDFGVLRYVDRFWTSDSNDALDRVGIQRGFSFFLPLELMGAHVGPNTCHTSGRRIGMAMRAAVAMFGDMGIEANPLEFSDDEREELAAAVALHKAHRGLIFGGELYRIDTEDYENAFAVIAANKAEALVSYAMLDAPARSVPGRLRLTGLAPDKVYTANIVWPRRPQSYSRSIIEALENAKLTGEALMNAGLQIPILHPATPLVIHLRAQR